MKGTIGLEYIGANSYAMLESAAKMERTFGISSERRTFGPEVAELHRDDSGGLAKRIIYGRRDYSKANSKGSRGVYIWYTLQQDRLYWILEPKSWRSTDCYFAAIKSDGTVYRLSQTEADEWLSVL